MNYHSANEKIKKNFSIKTMEKYLIVKKNEIIIYLGKGEELANIILSEIIQRQKKRANNLCFQ